MRKPAWQPPDWLFGPAWTAILGLAAWAAVLARRAAPDDAGRRSVLLLYAANFVFHLARSPLVFKYKRPDWALIEVAFLWGSVLALFLGLRALSDVARWLILWVTFAAFLNATIVRLNRPFRATA